MKDVEIKLETRNALSAMLSHAAVHSPYYREQEWARRLRAGSKVAFREIPITGKRLVREDTERFFPAYVPPSEGRIQIRHTSGSTGHPMLIHKTKRHFQINTAENHRLMDGWDLTRHRRVAEIYFPDENYPIGTLKQRVLENGAEQWTLATLDGAAAFDLFRRTSATMATAFPSIMEAALQHSGGDGQPLALQLISTISEVVSDNLRRLVRQIPGCRLLDGYGSVETGLIAMQCPLCDAYHLADRHLVVELLDENGRPVEPGQMGRVVLTPLFNRAMPLIRYEIGDYVIAGANTGCPRSAQGIARVIGRESGLFKLPDGTKVAAMLPPDIPLLMGLRHFKLFQTSFTDVEFHYVPKADGMEIAEADAQDAIDKYVSPRFRIHCRRVAEIPRSPSGKFLMHESLI